MLEISPRALNEWKRSAAGDGASKKHLGRPKLVTTLSSKIAIAREWKRQGYAGARAVSFALPDQPLRTIRILVAELKKRERRRSSLKRISKRISISVACSKQVLAIDATLTPQGKDVIVARDRASLLTFIEPCRKRARSFDTIRLLKKLEQDNRSPLVIVCDNGGAFTSAEVQNYCQRNKIVMLRSLPRTPQHNGACEIAVREVKEILKRGHDLKEVQIALNERRKRRRLGYQTPCAFDQNGNTANLEIDRGRLFNEAKGAVERSQVGIESVRVKRRAEREAILQVLERFGLVQITRGGQFTRSKSEDIR